MKVKVVIQENFSHNDTHSLHWSTIQNIIESQEKKPTQIYRHNFMTWILQDFKGFSMQDSNLINGSWQCHVDQMSYYNL
jgi:hypothetical protein